MRANSELLATPTNFSYLVRMREPRYYSDSNHGPKKQYHIIIITHAYVLSLYYNLATFNIQHWFKSECSLSLYIAILYQYQTTFQYLCLHLNHDHLLRLALPLLLVRSLLNTEDLLLSMSPHH